MLNSVEQYKTELRAFQRNMNVYVTLTQLALISNGHFKFAIA